MMASQKKPEAMTNLVRRGLYLPCMKNRMTSVALMTAIARARTIFQRPRSIFAAETVTTVHHQRHEDRGVNLRGDNMFRMFGHARFSLRPSDD